MKLHTIKWVKPLEVGRLQIFFDDDASGTVLDLSPILAQGGVFEPLRAWSQFVAVEVGPSGRTLLWRIGDEVVDLCADALWLTVHPEDRPAAAVG